jgi:hypothetical protein
MRNHYLIIFSIHILKLGILGCDYKACDVKKETMNAYCAEVRKLEDHLEGLEFHHVSHDNNVAPDVLSKLGSKRTGSDRRIHSRPAQAIDQSPQRP